MATDINGEGLRRMFASCVTVDDVIRRAKALGIELADSDLVAIVSMLGGGSSR